jgi:hypothetical protein
MEGKRWSALQIKKSIQNVEASLQKIKRWDSSFFQFAEVLLEHLKVKGLAKKYIEKAEFKNTVFLKALLLIFLLIDS